MVERGFSVEFNVMVVGVRVNLWFEGFDLLIVL